MSSVNICHTEVNILAISAILICQQMSGVKILHTVMLMHSKYQYLTHCNVSRYEALIPGIVYLFIWGFTSLSTLYRSYHDR